MAGRGGGFTDNVNGEEEAGLHIMLTGRRVADGGKRKRVYR